MKIVMLGPPGAGKGTYAVKISARYDIPHISTGDIFRANIKSGTDLGKKAKEYMDKGLLVPDALTVELLMDRIAKGDCKKGYVLDGFPRTLDQAEALKRELKKNGESLDYAINIDVPDEVIVHRMGGRRSCRECGAVYHVENVPPKAEGICDICGGKLILRDDDAPETVMKRLGVYHEKTQPLVDYYEKEGILRQVGGTAGIDEVFGKISDILG